MPKVLIYEHLSAACSPSLAPASLLAEGRAMLEAVAADLGQVSGVSLLTVLHADQPIDGMAHSRVLRNIGVSSLEPSSQLFQAVEFAAKAADAALVIAPESDGLLEGLLRWIGQWGARRLGPSPDSVRLWTDKRGSAERLGEWTLPTAVWPTIPRESGLCIVKPRDGAGCLHTLIVDAPSVEAAGESIRADGFAGELIVQPYAPGEPASVAVIADGQGGGVVLPSVRQRLTVAPSSVGSWRRLSYTGGEAPLEGPLDERARRLALRVLQVDPALNGYFGVDLLLGPAADGSLDRIVEVNPRLTTSYVGYRRLLQENLAQWLLDPSSARPPTLTRSGVLLQFRPDGACIWKER